MRICTVVGARPQFIKASVVSRELTALGIEECLVHTGQHYDHAMSRLFFEELDIPVPTVNLDVRSGDHAAQTGLMMTRLEEFIVAEGPFAAALVYGDTNSTLAGALVAAKLFLPVAHVEAGLRSFNRRMPEEINRVITDRLSTLLFCPSDSAVANLESEGIVEGVDNSGDVMYDALLRHLPQAKASFPLHDLTSFRAGQYYLATMHRPETVDSPSRLEAAVRLLGELDLPVVWPVHPRAAARLEEFQIQMREPISRIAPCGYLRMLSLIAGAKAVLTDSGGLQKEAFWMNKKCVTLRSETEWLETLPGGWNTLADLDPPTVRDALAQAPESRRPEPYGRGTAGRRIARLLGNWIDERTVVR